LEDKHVKEVRGCSYWT